MICIFCLRRNSHTFAHYLWTVWPAPHGARIRLVFYEDLPAFRPTPGLYIFTDIELIEEAHRQQAAELQGRLAASPGQYRLWNNPTRSIRRYDLLTELWHQRTNSFRAYRADSPLPPEVRFPVFVRDEHEHSGPLTPLLRDAPQVETALATLRRIAPPKRPLLVVEFLPYADAAGVYRKYAAMRVGNHIIPRHLFFSRDWVLKHESPDFLGPEWLEEERHYLEDNPHESELRSLFRHACLEYGRIDYTVVAGHIQVFEINSNPVLVKSPHLAPGPRLHVHQRFAASLARAFEDGDGGTRVPWPARLAWRYWGRLKHLDRVMLGGTSLGRTLSSVRRTAFTRSRRYRTELP